MSDLDSPYEYNEKYQSIQLDDYNEDYDFNENNNVNSTCLNNENNLKNILIKYLKKKKI